MALTIDGSDPTGDLGDLLDAKLPIAGGKILQIVRATDATDRETTSTSFVDASISVTITPQKSDSAILLVSTVVTQVAISANYADFQITDSSNNAISGAQLAGFRAAANAQRVPLSFIAYATPATTSATTYKLRFRSNTGTAIAIYNNTQSTGQMYAIEVSA